MANCDRIREEIITKFLLNTCQLTRRVSDHDVRAWRRCAALAAAKDFDYDFISLLTGSVAECILNRCCRVSVMST